MRSALLPMTDEEREAVIRSVLDALNTPDHMEPPESDERKASVIPHVMLGAAIVLICAAVIWGASPW